MKIRRISRGAAGGTSPSRFKPRLSADRRVADSARFSLTLALSQRERGLGKRGFWITGLNRGWRGLNTDDTENEFE